MSTEIFYLTLSSVFTLALSLPYAYARISRIGVKQLFLNPLPGDDPFENKWAHRAYRTHMNGIENIAIFAPLALAVHITGGSNAVTQASAAIYFWARVIHAPTYVFNVPVVRTAAFFAGWIACFVIGYQLLA